MPIVQMKVRRRRRAAVGPLGSEEQDPRSYRGLRFNILLDDCASKHAWIPYYRCNEIGATEVIDASCIDWIAGGIIIINSLNLIKLVEGKGVVNNVDRDADTEL